MYFQKLITLTAFILISFNASASNLKNFKIGSLYEGDKLTEVSLDDAIADIQPGSIIVLGELHAFYNKDGGTDYNEHQKKQLLFLNRLQALNPGKKINVGMEFINLTYNKEIEEYLADTVTDQEFIKNVGWTAHFASYKPLIKFPKASGGVTRGINLPRSISGKIAKRTPLTADEQKLMPPNFEVGRDEYRQRFSDLMGGGHLPPDAIEPYFEAQSSWDDTMAYQSVEYMKNRPDEFFVIIVGDFHAQFGGGLPDRLKARGAKLVVNISQISAGADDDSAITKRIATDKHGDNRGDFIWISE